jgi:multicomponent Na+:H+ antiporter subunit F
MIESNNGLLSFAVWTAYFSIGFTFLVVLFRLIRGPEITDRLIVLDLSASAFMALVIVLIISTGQTVFLNVALAVALVMFMGNIAFAGYLRKTLK